VSPFVETARQREILSLCGSLETTRRRRSSAFNSERGLSTASAALLTCTGGFLPRVVRPARHRMAAAAPSVVGAAVEQADG